MYYLGVQFRWTAFDAPSTWHCEQLFRNSRSPMAIAVIGGLFTSTVLSLLVVPVVFEYVDDVEHWARRSVQKVRGGGWRRARG